MGSGVWMGTPILQIWRTIRNYIMFCYAMPTLCWWFLFVHYFRQLNHQNVWQTQSPDHLIEEWLILGSNGSALLWLDHQHRLLWHWVQDASWVCKHLSDHMCQRVAALPVCLTWARTVSACMGRSDKGGQSSVAEPPGVNKRHLLWCNYLQQEEAEYLEHEAASQPRVHSEHLPNKPAKLERYRIVSFSLFM